MEELKDVSPKAPLEKPQLITTPHIVIVLCIALIILCLSAIFVVIQTIVHKPTASALQTGTVFSIPGAKQWISCDTQSDLLEEGSTIYVACNNGVLVVNETTGQVLQQITMAQGLGNNFVTNLVKSGNSLYIGTQDGFTIFNLKTKQAKKISVGQGLDNGANIHLTLDGTTLWVSTFNGIDSYDTLSGKITSYSKILGGESYSTMYRQNTRGLEVGQVLPTKNGVYIIPGSNTSLLQPLARYDRATKTFDIPNAPQYTASDYVSDLFSITEIQNTVYTSDLLHKGSIWMNEDKKNAPWVENSAIDKALLTQSNDSIELLGHYKNNLLINKANVLYAFDVTTNKLTQLPITLSSIQVGGVLSLIGNTIWTSNTNGWLNKTNLDTMQTTEINLKNRPISFMDIPLIINHHPLISSGQTIWQQELSGDFTQLLDLNKYATELTQTTTVTSVIQPIPATPYIFIFQEFCGEFCSTPSFLLWNYATHAVTSVPPSISLLPDRQTLFFAGFTPETNEFHFNVATGKPQLIFNSQTQQWTQGTTITQASGIYPFTDQTIQCNKVYTFTTTFSQAMCSDVTTNGKYSWAISDDSVIQTDDKTNEETTLHFPQAAQAYSPLEQVVSQGIRKVKYVDNNLFVLTDRGLSLYNTTTNNWKLYTTDNGFLTNTVTDAFIDTNHIWAVHEGGISMIEK